MDLIYSKLNPDRLLHIIYRERDFYDIKGHRLDIVGEKYKNKSPEKISQFVINKSIKKINTAINDNQIMNSLINKTQNMQKIEKMGNIELTLEDKMKQMARY